MSEVTNELLVLSSLVQNEEYARKVIPFLKDEYFGDKIEKRLLQLTVDYYAKYHMAPKRTDLLVSVQNDKKLNEQQTDEATAAVGMMYATETSGSQEFLLETTEKFCKDKAVFNAIQDSIAIYQGHDKTRNHNAIPDLLKDAIAVCFDNRIGIDFYDDAASRFDFYSLPESKLPFHLQILNDVTNGGVVRKTLNLISAGTNVGKSLTLIDLAAGYVRNGFNVLYVSLEMREELIMQRFDANMLRVAVNDVASLGKERFINRVEVLRQKSYGRFKVKEFPPGAASALNIQNVMDDLRLKQGFVPDIVMVDYIQITASAKMKPGSVNSYFYYKSVAEELRALGVENDCVVWSATQFNRGGMDASDANMSDISESTAIAFTADGMWAIFRTEELDAVGQLLWKQLKSRYANKSTRTKFVTGVDVDKQTLYDVDQHNDQLSGGGNQKGSAPVSTMSQGQLKNRFSGMNTGD
jgi:archaellum biogenesis ATPase FlaH